MQTHFSQLQLGELCERFIHAWAVEHPDGAPAPAPALEPLPGAEGAAGLAPEPETVKYTLPLSTVKGILTELLPGLTSQELEAELGEILERLCRAFDTRGDGEVELQEFICGLGSLGGPSRAKSTLCGAHS